MRPIPQLTLAAALVACGSAPAVPTTAASPPAGEVAPSVATAPLPLRPPTPGLVDVVDLSVGSEHACAIVGDGATYCWGSGAHYRLGDRRMEARTAVEPARDRVVGLDAARAVAAGGATSCAIEQDGEVWCWGGFRRVAGDPDGIRWPLADGATLVATPVTGIRAVAAGWIQATLLDGGGRLAIVDGYVGPVPLDAFQPAVQIAALTNGFCARDATGRVECVGGGDSGATGDGGQDGGWGEDPSSVLAPVVWSDTIAATLIDAEGDINYAPCASYEGSPPRPDYCDDTLSGAVDLDAHGTLACAVLADGRLGCWGCGDCFSEHAPPLGLGDGPAMIPRIVPGITDARRVAVGDGHICIVTKTNVTKCWGNNFEGQLGDPALPSSATPVVVTGLGDVVELDAGDATTCARRSDGTVTCWGRPLGTPPRERDEDGPEHVAWEDLPVLERVAPTEVGPPGPPGSGVCRDVDVLSRAPLESVVYTHDRQGRVTRAVRTIARETPLVQTTRYTRDRAGRIASEKAHNTEDDTLYRYTYDARGRISIEQGRGMEATRWRWTSRADGDRRVDEGVSEHRLDRIVYDAAGREIERREINVANYEASDHLTTWDAAGRKVSVRELWYPLPYFEHPFFTAERRFHYDDDGRLTRTEEHRLADDGTWWPWRTTVHLYSGCGR